MTDPVKPSSRKGPSLVAAARASSSRPTETPTASPSKPFVPGSAASASGLPPSMQRAGSSTTINSGGSSRSTPTPSEIIALPARSGIGGMSNKFKPKAPIRRLPKADASADVKPDIRNASPVQRGSPFRGQPRGRGRGGQMRQVMQGVASGVFGHARPRDTTSSRSPTKSATVVRFSTEEQVDEYSDDEEGNRTNVIDIALVSGLDESAPTSLYRDRRINEKKAKGDKKGKSKAVARPAGLVSGFVGTTGGEVKSEPISPEKLDQELPRFTVRDDDDMMDEDEIQNRDTAGRRISVDELGEVNESQKVDLSESESEEESDDMEGDFVLESGMDDPQDKLYMFQFPHLFPQFVSKAPVDLTQDTEAPADSKEGIKDVKPNQAGRKKKPPPPEGRIGTLVVMKSGRVKMVLGDDIVMNVTPGVPGTFVQNLTHLDAHHKSTTVLGEVNKTFIVTPDVDKLLQELYLNGGMTPADKALAERKRLEKLGVKLEPGLVKMEVD